jgi:hypothetical protein
MSWTPRQAPRPAKGDRELHLVTWNCIASDTTAKIERLAELVWGPPTQESFNDLVLI